MINEQETLMGGKSLSRQINDNYHQFNNETTIWVIKIDSPTKKDFEDLKKMCKADDVVEYKLSRIGYPIGNIKVELTKKVNI
jgi:hypothetical protein